MDYKTNDTTPASPDDDQLLKNISDYATGGSDVAAAAVAEEVAAKTVEHVDFIFGNGGATTLPPHPVVAAVGGAINTNGKRRSDQMDFNDDDGEEEAPRPTNDFGFGPETDVDAIDEAISTPMSPIKATINNEFIDDNKVSDLMNENDLESMKSHHIDASNPFSVQEIHHDLLADKFGSEYANGMDENKFLETVVEDVNDDLHAAHQAAAIGRIDFSEKKEFSFEREEFEKELDSISDVQAALQVADVAFGTVKTVGDVDDDEEQYDRRSTASGGVDNDQVETIAASNLQELLEVTHAEPAAVDMDSFIVPEPEHGKFDKLI